MMPILFYIYRETKIEIVQDKSEVTPHRFIS